MRQAAQPLRERRLVDFLEAEFAQDLYVSRNGHHRSLVTIASIGKYVNKAKAKKRNVNKPPTSAMLIAGKTASVSRLSTSQALPIPEI